MKEKDTYEMCYKYNLTTNTHSLVQCYMVLHRHQPTGEQYTNATTFETPDNQLIKLLNKTWNNRYTNMNLDSTTSKGFLYSCHFDMSLQERDKGQ